MAHRRKWRRRKSEPDANRRVPAAARGAGARKAPSRSTRVPVLGPYEFRYDVVDGYPDERDIVVR
jgi:hypothetical protein